MIKTMVYIFMLDYKHMLYSNYTFLRLATPPGNPVTYWTGQVAPSSVKDKL